MRDRIPPRSPLGPVAALAFVLLCVPVPAGAVVSDVRPVDGPSADVVDVADAAMAEDGSGGIVYLKRVEGRDHVYAARFVKGSWTAPQRVDAGQSFDSSWPRIGAGNGGRLVVTWVQEFGVESDRMFSATLDPGASGFQSPVPVDFNVGEATSTYPDLAMNRGGQAYLAYRVVTDASPANPPGYLGADLRVARYNGRLWSVLGTPLDRNVGQPVRIPSAENAPEVGIDVQGQGVVAWQEPDDEFVDRVWARRLFGASFGLQLQVSPSFWEGAPLRGGADAFSLDVSGFGQAAVAFRQQPGQASRLDGPRAFVNELPDVFSEKAGAFGGARLADGGLRADLGEPSVAVDPRGLFVAGIGSGPATLLASGDDASLEGVKRLDKGGSTEAGAPLVDLAQTGAAVAAWRELRGATGLVAVQERRADGVVEPTELNSARGGKVGRLAIGGSGLGDAILAWSQGSGANTQIAAAVVDAPPDPFLVLLPNGWQRRGRIPIAWDRTLNAIGGVRYSVSVDDEPVVENLRRLHFRLSRDQIEDGRHRIQIFATDEAGQETGSRAGQLLVDRNGPRLRLRWRGRTVVVAVTDGPRAAGSGLRRRSVSVSFGDRRGAGASASARRKGKKRKRAVTIKVRHTYSSGGSYLLRVRARDRAGNASVFARRVRVR